MDHADHFSSSIDLAVTTIQGTDPARYGDSSPCTEYTVGKVIDHIAFGLLLAERSGLRQAIDLEWDVMGPAPFLIGHPEQEWAGLIAEQGRRTVSAWAEPKAWEGEATFGGGAMPAAAIGSMLLTDLVVHSWDVAVATGRTVDVSAALAQETLAGVEALAQMGRDGGWYGPEVELPDDASVLDKALAASGRDPKWTP